MRLRYYGVDGGGGMVGKNLIHTDAEIVEEAVKSDRMAEGRLLIEILKSLSSLR